MWYVSVGNDDWGWKKEEMELDQKLKCLVAGLEREKNVREKAQVEARNLREEVDRLNGKLEEVRQ